MKILAIVGSRNAEGMTATATKSLLKGAQAAGAEVETVFLPWKNIERCRQCDDSGWGICRTTGNCVIEDDFAHLVNAIRSSDRIVLATPVYFSDLSESMKAFLDRLRRIGMHEKGKDGIEAKVAVAICVAGGGGGGAPQCACIMDRILRTCGFDLVETIPVRRQNLDLKKSLLETTGGWLASS